MLGYNGNAMRINTKKKRILLEEVLVLSVLTTYNHSQEPDFSDFQCNLLSVRASLNDYSFHPPITREYSVIVT